MKNSTRRQLRGEDLQKRIETVIRDLANEAKKAGKSFIYNATKVAERVPTTRKTLRSHDELIERVLAELKAQRRLVDGNATVEHLRDQIVDLKEQIEERDKTILTLRSYHADMFEKLHSNSIKAANLIRPTIESESLEAGHCLLCGGEYVQSTQKGNVVSLKERK
jgi:hypothetical protein